MFKNVLAAALAATASANMWNFRLDAPVLVKNQNGQPVNTRIVALTDDSAV